MSNGIIYGRALCRVYYKNLWVNSINQSFFVWAYSLWWRWSSASVADALVYKLPDAGAAATHLKTTLLSAHAGAYEGTEA